ncbi:hypothetical protein LH991_05980 [Schleiferilactobacillus harbinensis]|jgi:hypothetical protein|uniref:Calcineurin-like phosphoesterase domain-containing protein n=1 Tax=Schleiferilactobacillus harbinensis DSM 16991 TaxID=1122147 RepID=A0A0R1XD16_9LACO|nr:metallophosphoesterase [Schleiferilactobacillus harbinensis]KRM28039.1 hypothetical protein FC91_GL002129 [Schleiferilactobacillus harbinensis DSM 16991]QFR63549.1 hypothetical protein LH991_05980 [Schleiferilactobacillus harbinensis]
MSPELQFFMITDTHAAARPTAGVSNADIAIAVQNMRKIAPAALLIHGGDYTTMSEADVFAEQLQIYAAAGFPAYQCTLGNHDVRGRKNGQAERPDAQGWLDDWKIDWRPETDRLADVRFAPWRETTRIFQDFQTEVNGGAQLYGQIAVDGFRILRLCTERPLKDQCWLSSEQLTWLDQSLAAIRQESTRPIVVISHQALTGTHSRSEEYGGFGEQDSQVKEILGRYSEIVFLSGHIHNGLGVAKVLQAPFGLLVDVPSYTTPDVGLPMAGICILATLTPTMLRIEPYFIGTEQSPDARLLKEYQTVLAI